jgi:hypothetical protein
MRASPHMPSGRWHFEQSMGVVTMIAFDITELMVPHSGQVILWISKSDEVMATPPDISGGSKDLSLSLKKKRTVSQSPVCLQKSPAMGKQYHRAENIWRIK